MLSEELSKTDLPVFAACLSGELVSWLLTLSKVDLVKCVEGFFFPLHLGINGDRLLFDDPELTSVFCRSVDLAIPNDSAIFLWWFSVDFIFCFTENSSCECNTWNQPQTFNWLILKLKLTPYLLFSPLWWTAAFQTPDCNSANLLMQWDTKEKDDKHRQRFTSALFYNCSSHYPCLQDCRWACQSGWKCNQTERTLCWFDEVGAVQI